MVEHTPKKLSNKRYKRRTKSTLKFVFQKDPQFDLAGDIVQVKDTISQIESGFTMDHLDGATLVLLSDYIVVELSHWTYSGVVMGMSKDKNLAMLFRKVSKRRCQQINKTMWDKEKETFDLAQSVAYTNVRGKSCLGAHSTYVCYGHRTDPMGKTLGH
jgi:hypothetical protein